MQCNKIAFGHHMDDVVETLLLNLIFQGEISTMPPNLEMFGGKLRIIRPLIYVEEDELRRFAKECDFPSQLCACPNSKTSMRRFAKDLIKTLTKKHPAAKTNLFRSMQRIKQDYLV
jgi:tRNA 2-thiocytidine biosynthesis protein TtcA